MAAPKTLAEPHKEIRFTRAAQAQGFFITGAISLAFALLFTLIWFQGHPSLLWWMPLPFLLISLFFIRLGIRCTRHAYLILTPLGIEIFPFVRPQKNLNLIYWSELQGFEINEEKQLLMLHRDSEKTSGIIISLKPILSTQQILLAKTLTGRFSV